MNEQAYGQVGLVVAEKKRHTTIDPDRALVAILFLLAAEREERVATEAGGAMRKTEVLLADSGLALAEIAAVMGKKYMAVAKILSRARERTPDGA